MSKWNFFFYYAIILLLTYKSLESFNELHSVGLGVVVEQNDLEVVAYFRQKFKEVLSELDDNLHFSRRRNIEKIVTGFLRAIVYSEDLVMWANFTGSEIALEQGVLKV